MALDTKDTGRKTKHVAKESSTMLVGKSMMENGPTTWLMASEFSQTGKVQDMREVGKTIFSMAKVLKVGHRGQHSKVSITKD